MLSFPSRYDKKFFPTAYVLEKRDPSDCKPKSGPMILF